MSQHMLKNDDRTRFELLPHVCLIFKLIETNSVLVMRICLYKATCIHVDMLLRFINIYLNCKPR